MSAPRSRRDRGGLRDIDDHASWRQVYAALDADPDQHEEVRYDG